jgi:hypothetical protein
LPLEDIKAARQLGRQEAGPDYETAPVPVALEVGEETVENVWLGRENVDCVYAGVVIPALLDALDIWLLFSTDRPFSGVEAGGHTGYIVVQNVIFVDSAVDDLLGDFV